MQAVLIILLSVGAAVAHGVAHNQITARVCVEYFTVGHPPVFGTDAPTLLGLGWGVIATWWAGALLGVPLALAARSGTRPDRTARSLVRPVGVLLSVMAGSALLAGAAGFALAGNGSVFLRVPLASRVPPDRHARSLADLWAHSAGYLAGLGGGVVLTVRVWRSRRRPASPRTRAAA